MAYREHYTSTDKYNMIMFWKKELKQNNIDAWNWKGNRLWDKAASEKITTHSAQSMRDHMRRRLYKNLDFAPVKAHIRDFIKRKLREGHLSNGGDDPLAIDFDDDNDDDDELQEIDDDSESDDNQRSGVSTPKTNRRRTAGFMEFSDSDENFLRFARPPVPFKRRLTDPTHNALPPQQQGTNMKDCWVDLTPLPVESANDSNAANDFDEANNLNETIEIIQHEENENNNDERSIMVVETPDNEMPDDPPPPATNGLRLTLDESMEYQVPAAQEGENEEAPMNQLKTSDLMEDRLSQLTETSHALAVDVPDTPNVSLDESFESASALSPPSSPKHRPMWRRFVAEKVKVENNASFQKKLGMLGMLGYAYNVSWKELSGTVQQLREEKSTVDLMSVEITLWRKGYRRQI